MDRESSPAYYRRYETIFSRRCNLWSDKKKIIQAQKTILKLHSTEETGRDIVSLNDRYFVEEFWRTR